MVTGQDGFEPFLDQLLAGPGNCADAGIQSRGDLAVAPSFASLRGVGLQQDARLQPPPRRVFALMDQCVEPVACNRGKPPGTGALFACADAGESDSSSV